MASIAMSTTSLVVSGVSPSGRTPSVNTRRGLVIVKASGAAEVDLSCETKQEKSCGRRSLVSTAAAIAAAAACSVASIALADEPKRGSEEAKKKYAAVCVTMPTARICRN